MAGGSRSAESSTASAFRGGFFGASALQHGVRWITVREAAGGRMWMAQAADSLCLTCADACGSVNLIQQDEWM